MTLKEGDKVRCAIPHLHLDFIGEVVNVGPMDVIMIKDPDSNMYVTTRETHVEVIRSDSVGRLATPTDDPTGHA